MRDRLRSFTRPLFIVVLVLALILGLIKPSLLPGVLAGLAVALLCALLPRQLGPRGRKIAAAITAVVVVIVAAVLVFGGSSKKSGHPPARAIELGSTLDVAGDYSSKTGSLIVKDTLTIDAAEFAKAVNSPTLPVNGRRGLSAAKLESGVSAGLRSQGWSGTTTSRGLTARRNRSFRVKQHTVVPGVSKNMIPIAQPTKLQSFVTGGGNARFLPIEFTVLKGTLVIKAPRYLISATDPSSDAKPTTDNRDSRTIALDSKVDKVAFDVRSKAFRNEALHSVTSWTTWTPLKWLLGLVVALANGAVRERIKGLFKRGSRAEAQT